MSENATNAGHFGCCDDWGTGHDDATCPCRSDGQGVMTGDAPDLTTQTPAEVDTAVAPIEEAIGGKTIDIILTSQEIRFIKENLERQEKGQYVARWTRKTQDDLTRAEMHLDRLRDERDGLVRQAQPYRDEYARRGGWTRAWVVLNTNGHVHNSRACSTCFPTTRFGWLPQVSGLTEDEIVAQAGSDACTVCYPSAPVETAGERTLLHRSEEEARQAKAAREQAKAERAAKKAAKAIANPDGTSLKVFDWTVPERRYQERDGSVRVEPAHDRYMLIETAHAAKAWLTDSQEEWRSSSKRPEDVQRVAEALATKFGTTPESEVEAAKKRAAKRR